MAKKSNGSAKKLLWLKGNIHVTEERKPVDVELMRNLFRFGDWSERARVLPLCGHQPGSCHCWDELEGRL